MTTPFFITAHGYRTWKHTDGDQYIVTGIGLDGERVQFSTTNWTHASKLKLYRGGKWLLRAGRRYLILKIIPPKKGLH